jgi:hypothetical protein
MRRNDELLAIQESPSSRSDEDTQPKGARMVGQEWCAASRSATRGLAARLIPTLATVFVRHALQRSEQMRSGLRPAQYTTGGGADEPKNTRVAG